MAAMEVRANKISKRTKDRKPHRQLSTDIVSSVLESNVNQNNVEADVKTQEKKSQGIVIDGKTYTCATCKAGHRVGVCKHGKERPMKATHPPGRPPAGAPKKVVCDCPKSCTCAKRDCKCARNCNCTQVMYMLVYIPNPDEDEDAEEERGQWKLGDPVTTDLKGNILTPEQVKERQTNKDAMKEARSRSTSVATTLVEQSKPSLVIDESDQSQPASCCKHKQNVTVQQIAAQVSPQSANITKSSAEGCNCGHKCNCAFCPQHPNNSTSMNMAREQAVHFVNHPSMDESSIVPFIPTMPQGLSCMGGQPRFAMSRHADRPSFEELQHIFPNPGFVIGYPIWPLEADQQQQTPSELGVLPVTTGFAVSPDHSMGNSLSSPSPSSSSHIHHAASMQTPYTPSTSHHPANFVYASNQFGIGDAFVASSGAGIWPNQVMQDWNLPPPPPPPTTTSVSNNMDIDNSFDLMPDGSVVQINHQQPPSNGYHSIGDTGHFLSPSVVVDDQMNVISQQSCCQPSEDMNVVGPYFSPNLSSPVTSDSPNGFPNMT